MLDQVPTLDQRVEMLETYVAKLLAMDTSLLTALVSAEKILMGQAQQIKALEIACNTAFGVTDSTFAEVFEALELLSKQAVKDAFGITDEQLDEITQPGFPMTGDDYNHVMGIEGLTVYGPSGEEVTLTFPGGDVSIINEQGLFGFKLIQPANMMDYLDDIVVALFEQGLVSDEGSDAILNITEAYRRGTDPDLLDVALVNRAAAVTPEHVATVRLWIEGGAEGFLIQSAEGLDVNGTLLGVLWVAIVIAANKDINSKV